MRLFARYQGWLFFPLLLLEGLNLHVASVQAVVAAAARRRTDAAEALLLLACTSPPTSRRAVLVLSPAAGGGVRRRPPGPVRPVPGLLVRAQPQGHADPRAEADELDFLRRQVLTSRNVRGGRLVDVVLGGLNYQIEHHLFPSMPRPNLRRAQPLIRRFCAEHGIAYPETSLVGS